MRRYGNGSNGHSIVILCVPGCVTFEGIDLSGCRREPGRNKGVGSLYLLRPELHEGLIKASACGTTGPREGPADHRVLDWYESRGNRDAAMGTD